MTAPDPAFPPLHHFFTDLAMTYGRMGIGRHVAVAPVVDALVDDARVPTLGFLGTVADGVAGFAVLPIADPDWTATSDLGVHVTGAPAGSSVLIDAQVVRAGSRLVVMKVTVHDGGDDRVDVVLGELRAASTEVSTRPLIAHSLLSFVRMAREKSRARDIRTDEIIDQIAPRNVTPPDVPLIERIGLRVLDGERATVEVDNSEYVHNSMGSITGGIHVVAAEAAAAVCVPELACTGIDLRFLSPVRVGPMRATATPLRHGPTDALVTVDLTDGTGHPVSVGTVAVGTPRRVSGSTERATGDDVSETDANKQLVNQFWEALAVRDWDGMKALLTDDAHYTDVGVPGPGGTGPDGVVARVKIGLEPLSGYSHLPGTNMIAEGDLVMTEHTERWTFHTGEVIDHSFVSVTQLRDGKICRWHDYSNISNITDNAPGWWIEHIMNAAGGAAS